MSISYYIRSSFYLKVLKGQSYALHVKSLYSNGSGLWSMADRTNLSSNWLRFALQETTGSGCIYCVS